jgi:hypothetical protein
VRKAVLHLRLAEVRETKRSQKGEGERQRALKEEAVHSQFPF